MNEKKPSKESDSEQSILLTDVTPTVPPPSSDNNTDKESQQEQPATPDRWRVLLIEQVHLLGLFLTHARHAKSARATAVLFEQFIRHLDILSQMPDHDGGMIIRHSGYRTSAGAETHNYLILFGNVVVHSRDVLNNLRHTRKQSVHVASALRQAFGCLAEQGIYALYLQLPGRSAEKIDHLRLALNIVARFRHAVENNTSITFGYFGRALNIPVVRDTRGRPDPNLTLVAGLNGLSTANARELIKQAEAYCKLSYAKETPARPAGNYNQIFSVRSLRSQLIRPPVEINNFPWMSSQELLAGVEEEPGKAAVVALEAMPVVADASSSQITACTSKPQPLHPKISRKFLAAYVDTRDKTIKAAVDAFLTEDYPQMDARALGIRLTAVTKLLHAVDKHPHEPVIAERLLGFLHDRLQRVPETVLDTLVVQRQGVKIISQGRTFLVGMVHPRLFDLITLVKERLVTRYKIAAVRAQSFDFENCDHKDLAHKFEINVADAQHLLALLKPCFDATGGFNRMVFEARIDTMAQYENTIFEMLWCYLRQTPRRQDRLAFLNAMPLLIARFKDPKRELRFLLADLCQAPFQIDVTDRNAFTLANVLLQTHNKEAKPDIDRTPESVLEAKTRLNHQAIHYASWRLDIDQVRILTKFHTISDQLKQNMMDPSVPKEAEFLLALEREALIFMALVGGKTARLVFRRALTQYGDPDADIYQSEAGRRYLPQLIPHLRIVVRGLGRIGRRKDIESLKALEKFAPRLRALDTDPEHAVRLKGALQWVVPAMKAIQLHAR